MQKLTTQEFIDKSKSVHSEKYDYSDTEYIGSKSKLKIICPLHGLFYQSASAHMSGQGCPKCNAVVVGDRFRMSTDWFISESNRLHGEGTYDYSQVKYVHSREKVTIICPHHGLFLQRPLSHARDGHKCPFCIPGVSKASKIWLDSLGVPHECREIPIVINQRKIRVDAFIANINTVYEFWGDYWHGNPKRFQPDVINRKIKEQWASYTKKPN